jgi:hypothetical protein
MLTKLLCATAAGLALGAFAFCTAAEGASFTRIGPAMPRVGIGTPMLHPIMPMQLGHATLSPMQLGHGTLSSIKSLPSRGVAPSRHLPGTGEIAAKKQDAPRTPIHAERGTSGRHLAARDDTKIDGTKVGTKPGNRPTGQTRGDDKKTGHIVIKDNETGVVSTTEIKGDGSKVTTTVDPVNGTTTVENRSRLATTTTVTRADGSSTRTTTDKLDGKTTVVEFDKDKNKVSSKVTNKDGSSVTTLFGKRSQGDDSEVWIKADKNGTVTAVGYSNDSDLEEVPIKNATTKELYFETVDPVTKSKTETRIAIPSGVVIRTNYTADGTFVSEEEYDPATGLTTVTTEGRL